MNIYLCIITSWIFIYIGHPWFPRNGEESLESEESICDWASQEHCLPSWNVASFVCSHLGSLTDRGHQSSRRQRQSILALLFFSPIIVIIIYFWKYQLSSRLLARVGRLENNKLSVTRLVVNSTTSGPVAYDWYEVINFALRCYILAHV